MLDIELLKSYETRLRDQSVPIDTVGRPGLSEREMANAVASIGVELPTEARLWWGWHDGADNEYRKQLIAPVAPKLLSLAEAVDTYRSGREIALLSAEPDIPALANPDDRWAPWWLPIRGPQTPLVIDCSVAAGEPTPIRVVDFEDVEGTPRPIAASLGDMVCLWGDLIDAGAWRWDSDKAEWQIDETLMDRDQRVSDLV